jgi:hypothetical protein
MRRKTWYVHAAAAAALISLEWSRSAPLQNQAAPAAGSTGFKITFGDRQETVADYSGSVSLSSGKVVRIMPWRFQRDDGVSGSTWKLKLTRMLFENQPDLPRPIPSPGQVLNIVPAGVVVTVDAPETAGVQVKTAQGNFDFRLADLRDGRVLSFRDGDVLVQRAMTPEKISAPTSEEHDYPSLAVTRSGAVWICWQAYENLGDHVYARHSTASGWSQAERLTEQKSDIYQTAVAEDSTGRIWVIWSERAGEDWDLYARTYDGRSWAPRRKLTSAHRPNIFHRLVADRAGNLHLVWIGYQEGQSHVYWSRLRGNDWTAPREISGASAWMPAAATDSKGNLYVAWDSYRNGNYDIYFRRIGSDGTVSALEQVTKSPHFQAHASLAVDREDRVWLAWDESGANWGKDYARDDTWRGVVLYSDRRPRVAVWENGTWKQPAADPLAAMPRRYNRYVETPRLACDSTGRVWMELEVRTSTANNRADWWASNGRWERFLTSFTGTRWTPAESIPNSSTRPEGVFQIAGAARGIWAAWVNDNRGFGGPAGAGAAARAALQQEQQRNEIDAASYGAGSAPGRPELIAFAEPPGMAALGHRDEAGDVKRIRAFPSAGLRIYRGDFHRHTEISADGAGDGSLEDFFRYMMDAAAMDTGIVSDHNAGDREYTWWRTEKAIDLFHIPGGYTPLFGYERSVPYPNGHRNVVFDHRGVKVLPIGRDEQQGNANTGTVLYPYLKQNRGICFLHSLATNQGSDYRDNDPEVEPLVEIYQGYHANYEYEGAPRAETADYQVTTHGGYKPAGFWWNALRKGYKLGTQSSSDHISTHTSYTMIYSPSPKRADLVESMRKRHAYGATDNIVLEYRAGEHMMGDAFAASTPPRMTVKVAGTSALDTVEIIKDGKFVYVSRPEGTTAEFTYVDQNPEKRESWYYVRVMQKDRQMAWSSPMWIRY